MSTIQFGVQYNGIAMAGLENPLDFAERMEGLGYRSFFVPDIETLPVLDPLVLLSAVAQRTRRMRLGTGVLGLPFRSPYQLAKAVASLDVLSEGRVVLGVGSGGMFPKDMEVEGVRMEDRRSLTDERLELVRRLLSETSVTHHGAFHHMEDATLQPRPAQQPNPPIWTGAMWNNGFARRPLERTARWADGFHPNGMPAQAYAEAKDIISESAASLGRDPAALEWSCNIYLCMGPTKQAAFQEAERAMAQQYGDDAWDIDPATLILGPFSECVETIEEFAAAGATHFTINPLCEQPTLVANFEQFAAEIIPHFERR